MAIFKEYTNYDALGIAELIRNKEISPIDPLDSCLLYTSPSPRDGRISRMPSSA